MAIHDAQLLAEALKEIRPFDKAGGLAKKIRDLAEFAEAAAATGGKPADPAALALIITGEPEACAVMASAYAKALHAYGLTEGFQGQPRVTAVDWPGDFEDASVSRQLQEYNWAYGNITTARHNAAGGVLLIPGIYNRPYAGWPDEEDASPKAEAGALRAITSFMGDGAEKRNTPVVVLTGEAAPLQEFMERHADMQKLFEGKSAAVTTTDPEIPVALAEKITVRGKLRLKARKPSLRY